MNKYAISSETTKNPLLPFQETLAESFYYVKYGLWIITSKILSKILSNEKKKGVSRKIVCFGILIHVLSWRQQKCQYLCFNCWDFFTSFWRNNWQSLFDVVERLCYSYESKYVSTFVKKKVLGFSLGKIHTKVSKYLCTFVKKSSRLYVAGML